jgi:hypothetical protein
MKPEYIPFYLDGREDTLVRHAIDPDDVAAAILAGGKSVHEALHEVADAAVKAKLHDKRKGWLREHAEDIKESGGDESEAWDHFVAGRVDELVSTLETATIEALIELVDVDEDEDDENSGEGDDGEDDNDAEGEGEPE